MGLKKIKLSSVHLYGGVYRVRRSTTYWDMAKRMAKEISVSQQHLMDSPARYVRLLKADYWSVKGLMFNITFHVKGVDRISVAYAAQVWSNICKRPIKVFTTFDKVPGSERKPKDWEINGSNNSDKKVSTKKMGKKGLDLFKGLSSSVAMTSSELDCRNDTGKLRTHAFYVLLGQIRSQRSWHYSRCASTIWRKLPESEKLLFLGEAVKRLEKK